MTVETTLAEIMVEIRHMREDIGEMKTQALHDQASAEKSRTKVHARLDVVADAVTALQEQRKTDRERLDSVQVVTDEVKRWKIMGMTSLSIIGIGAAAFGITFSDAIKRLALLLTGRL